MKTKYKCLYEITGCIEDVATFLVPLKDLPKQEQSEREAIAVWLEQDCEEQYLADRVRAGDFAKEKGHTENCVALGDDCPDHLPPSLVGVGENNSTTKQEQGEPAPLLEFYEYEWQGEIHEVYRWLVDPRTIQTGTKLYATPQPQPQQEQKQGEPVTCNHIGTYWPKPLTDEQIIEIKKTLSFDMSKPYGHTLGLARAIEAAHNIKE